jgi:hypothetical protein
MRSVLSFLIFAVSGCIVVDNSSGNHHDGAAEPMPSVTGTTVYRIQPGAATTVSPGQVAGYGITANTGGSYRIFWTGDSNRTGTYSEFWGTMWTPGHFSAFVPGCNGGACPLESNDFVSSPYAVQGGQRIDWDTFATDGLDGFDVVTDAEPVLFDFFIDGARYPNLVFFPATDNGGAVSPVATFPFGLTTQ